MFIAQVETLSTHVFPLTIGHHGTCNTGVLFPPDHPVWFSPGLHNKFPQFVHLVLVCQPSEGWNHGKQSETGSEPPPSRSRSGFSKAIWRTERMLMRAESHLANPRSLNRRIMLLWGWRVRGQRWGGGCGAAGGGDLPLDVGSLPHPHASCLWRTPAHIYADIHA